MTYQIDQSGKIEQTSKNTVLCLANNRRFALLMKAKTKRQLQEVFRRNGQIRNFVLFTFCACLSLLLKKSNFRLDNVTIDQEYFGRESVIKEILLEILRKEKRLTRVDFAQIGRRVNAHKFAYLVFIRKLKPNTVINFVEILNQIKKTEVGKRLKDA